MRRVNDYLFNLDNALYHLEADIPRVCLYPKHGELTPCFMHFISKERAIEILGAYRRCLIRFNKPKSGERNEEAYWVLSVVKLDLSGVQHVVYSGKAAKEMLEFLKGKPNTLRRRAFC